MTHSASVHRVAGDPVVAEAQPIINKMIPATDKCCDGNEAGGGRSLQLRQSKRLLGGGDT